MELRVSFLYVLFQNQILAFFFDISTSTKFEIAIAIVILSNMITMAMDHYKMSDIWNYALFCLNIMFTTIYSLECIVKIIGLRQQYFLYAWNIFDFIIVLVSITGNTHPYLFSVPLTRSTNEKVSSILSLSQPSFLGSHINLSHPGAIVFYIVMCYISTHNL